MMWNLIKPRLTIIMVAIACAALAFVIAAIGISLYGTFNPKAKEAYTPQVTQKDGSIIVEKRPEEVVKPPHQIPKGAKVEREIKVTVKPKENHIRDAAKMVNDHIADANKKVDCNPVTLDLSVIRNDDGSSNVVASSPDGDIVGAVDIPVVAKIEPVKKWAAGISYNSDKRGGVWIERDIYRVRAGLDVTQSANGVTTTARVGWTF